MIVNHIVHKQKELGNETIFYTANRNITNWNFNRV